nr:hypothetical protein [Tanacetum cinerariifolium]
MSPLLLHHHHCSYPLLVAGRTDLRIEDSPTGTGDSPTGIGDSFAGIGYHITGTAGTRWRKASASSKSRKSLSSNGVRFRDEFETIGSKYYIPGLEEPEQAPPSPDYIPESDFEAHPEDDDDEDPEEDPVDYLADGGDDGDDEEESSEDDEDDEMDIEADEEEEEEHLAPADSVVVASTAADQAPSVKETEP